MEGDSPGGRRSPLSELLRQILPGRRRAMTEKELQEIIDESEEEGIINEEEGEMLHSIFEFGETIVREVMVPRTDMVCCPVESTLQEVLNAILASGHSRIPVYEGSNDHIVGIIYAKDLLRYWGRQAAEITPEKVMRDPYFVPETKNIEELLREFRTQRVHMAIAIDEYGGTSGLITIEDLIEEIIGDIQDEYDVEEEWLQPQEDGSLLVDGRLNIEDLEEEFDLEIPREKFDTVGGYLFNLFGHVPKAGEEIEDSGLQMTIVAADERKISKVRVRRPLPAGEKAEGNDA